MIKPTLTCFCLISVSKVMECGAQDHNKQQNGKIIWSDKIHCNFYFVIIIKSFRLDQKCTSSLAWDDFAVIWIRSDAAVVSQNTK